jgi:hypothetical protein
VCQSRLCVTKEEEEEEEEDVRRRRNDTIYIDNMQCKEGVMNAQGRNQDEDETCDVVVCCIPCVAIERLFSRVPGLHLLSSTPESGVVESRE